MQMMTYLDVVQQNMGLVADDEDAQLAGALYLHLQNPRLRPSDIKTDIASALLAKERYEGVLVADDEMLHGLEPELDVSEAAKVFPFKFRKDGSTAKSNSIITMDQLKSLLKYTEMKITDAGNAIFDGEVELNPYKPASGMTAMTNSPYTAIMQFDPMLPENSYRIQTAASKAADIMAQIETEVKRRELH